MDMIVSRKGPDMMLKIMLSLFREAFVQDRVVTHVASTRASRMNELSSINVALLPGSFLLRCFTEGCVSHQLSQLQNLTSPCHGCSAMSS
jgi:hypothetical protein